MCAKGVTPCRARTKQGGECQAAAMANGRCRKHGGKVPSGIAHYNYQGGRYSKHIPSRLSETYAASVADPDLLALRSEIAVIDSRLCELLQAVEESGSAETWEEMRETIEQRRKLVDSERGRLKDLGAMISAERAMLLIRTLTASIKRHVTDRNALAAIAREFGDVVGRDGASGPSAD